MTKLKIGKGTRLILHTSLAKYYDIKFKGDTFSIALKKRFGADLD